MAERARATILLCEAASVSQSHHVSSKFRFLTLTLSTKLRRHLALSIDLCHGNAIIGLQEDLFLQARTPAAANIVAIKSMLIGMED
jgi:hypothetical protein